MTDPMIVALAVVLGVDLTVIVLGLIVVLGRRRWVAHQPGAFHGAIRVVEGESAGLSGKWRSGYGRRVRDVLVWVKGPLSLRNIVIPVDGAGVPSKVARVRRPRGVRRAIPLEVPGARLEVAVRPQDVGAATSFGHSGS